MYGGRFRGLGAAWTGEDSSHGVESAGISAVL